MPEPQFISKSEIDTKAKELKDKRKLPDKPGDMVSFKELKSWLALLTPDMTEGNRIIIYVYRADPVVNNQLVDPSSDNNIDVISGSSFEHFTEEYIIDRHGGGTFKFLVKDLDKPKETRGGYFEAKITIPMIQFPPKLDLRTVDWDHKNNKGFRAWARAQKLIDENNMPVMEKKDQQAQQNNGNNPDAMVQAMKMAMDFAKGMSQEAQERLKKQLGAEDSLGKSIGDILLEKMKQDDPNKQLQVITTMMTAMKGMQPENKGGSELATLVPLFVQMMQNQAEQANKQFQMMMTMFQNQNQAKENSGEQRDDLSRLKDLLEVAKEIKGGGGVSHKSEVTEWIEAGASILNPVLNIVGNMIALKANAGASSTPSNVAPINQPRPQVVVAQPQSNIDRINEENKQNMIQQPQQPNVVGIDQPQAVAIVKQFGPIILNKLSGEGWEFGAWIAEGFGDPTAASIARYGVDGLLTAAKSVPEFWQQIEHTYGEPHLRKWLESFVNYKEEMKKIEESENDD